MQNIRFKHIFLFLGLYLFGLPAFSQKSDMIVIKGGEYSPLYGDVDKEVKVFSFLLDQYPVTNEEFLDFARDQEEWQKDKPIKLYADEAYLSHWAAPLDLGQALPNSAVTNVSWFAAKAYCAWK